MDFRKFRSGIVPPGKAHPSQGIVELVVVIVPPPGSGRDVPLRQAGTIHNYTHPIKTRWGNTPPAASHSTRLHPDQTVNTSINTHTHTQWILCIPKRLRVPHTCCFTTNTPNISHRPFSKSVDQVVKSRIYFFLVCESGIKCSVTGCLSVIMEILLFHYWWAIWSYWLWHFNDRYENSWSDNCSLEPYKANPWCLSLVISFPCI